MTRDLLHDLVEDKMKSGFSNDYWWDESRIPLDTVDKRVTELLDLRGKKAVVTGGAGINLGQACVNRLAGLGADVAVVDMTPEVAETSGRQRWASPPDADAVAARASEKWGTEVIAVHGDVMDYGSVEEVMRECNERLGGIDILVNSAADAVMGEFATLTAEQIKRTVTGSFLGTMYCTRVVLEYLIPKGSGCIINIGSESSQTAFPGHVVYGASKAALNTFTRFVGKEAARHGIRVVCVNPGSMWGPDRPFGEPTLGGVYATARTAIQRYELPEEVANMVAFLASDAASCMAGEVINMGGGMGL